MSRPINIKVFEERRIVIVEVVDCVDCLDYVYWIINSLKKLMVN